MPRACGYLPKPPTRASRTEPTAHPEIAAAMMPKPKSPVNRMSVRTAILFLKAMKKLRRNRTPLQFNPDESPIIRPRAILAGLKDVLSFVSYCRDKGFDLPFPDRVRIK